MDEIPRALVEKVGIFTEAEVWSKEKSAFAEQVAKELSRLWGGSEQPRAAILAVDVAAKVLLPCDIYRLEDPGSELSGFFQNQANESPSQIVSSLWAHCAARLATSLTLDGTRLEDLFTVREASNGKLSQALAFNEDRQCRGMARGISNMLVAWISWATQMVSSWPNYQPLEPLDSSLEKLGDTCKALFGQLDDLTLANLNDLMEQASRLQTVSKCLLGGGQDITERVLWAGKVSSKLISAQKKVDR